MINITEYKARRKQVANKIGSTGIFILFSAKELLRNGDAFYPYRQNSDFYYLTGFEEPESIMVILPNHPEGEFILFNRIRDPEFETWDGPRAGQLGACEIYGADRAFPIHEFNTMLPTLLDGREAVYYPFGVKLNDELITSGINQLKRNIRKGMIAPSALFDATSIVHEMRLFKSNAERAVMQKAADITTKAHLRAMSICKPGMYEYELEAALTYEFQRQGARHPAYSSIVGAGKNSCVLHYVDNRDKIEDNTVVLIDAGAEYQNYASDVTRTFPANGRFSAEQKAVYEIVLAAQKAAIDYIRPGKIMVDTQTVVLSVLVQGLVDLGLLKGNVDSLIEQKAYLPFYMHRPGHWLGLDVHDAGSYQVDGKWRTIESSMVFTVEPGLYIASSIQGVPERFHHIGVRIEDDIYVTDAGCEVLTKALPKEINEIEAIMADSACSTMM